MKKTLAIIPARKGSKRITNKNIKKFNGIPIIAYTIKAAKKSKIFDYISVSTDCKIIAKVAIKYGAKVDFKRPKKISDDKTKTIDVINHAINFYNKDFERFKYTCCLYPASPFIDYKNIIEAYNALKNSKCDMVFTAQEFPSPIQRAIKVKNKKVSWLNKKFSKKNSNFMEKFFFDSGQFYFGSTKKFLKKDNIINKNTKIILLKKYSNIDINCMDDWYFAEKIYKISV